MIRNDYIPSCNNIKVKVLYAGICGSDSNNLIRNPKLNVINMGHEIVGYIVENNKKIFGIVNPFICSDDCQACKSKSNLLCDNCISIGKSNFMTGGYSGFINIPDINFYRIDKIDKDNFIVGVLADSIAVIIHAFHDLTLNLDSKILIIGSGPIGILSSLYLVSLKYKNTFLYCRNEQKSHYLTENFPEINIIDNLSSEAEFDVIVEAVGGNQADTLELAVKKVNNSGLILVLGAFSENVQIKVRNIFYKQLTVKGVNSFCNKNCDFDKSIKWIENNQSTLKKLITNLFVYSKYESKIYNDILSKKLIKGVICFE